MWDPETYEEYADERSRAFFELVGRIRAERPDYVADLGCGTGRLTATLARRWPHARVEGVDSSAEMIEAARGVLTGHRGHPEDPEHLEHPAVPEDADRPGAAGSPEQRPGLRFSVADLTGWTPPRPADVIVSNAALQWVPEHPELLLPGLVDALAPGGWLAFQVPGNFGEPSHTILRELCDSPPWRNRLGGLSRARPVPEPGGYLTRLAALGCAVDAWETTYLQILQGADPVLGWVKGTALRPVLAALDEAAAEGFLAEYGARLRAAYPRRRYGTVFPFRRIFVVARRPSR